VTNTPRLQRILDSAIEQATQQGREYIGVEHVMLAILADRDAVPTQVMEKRLGLDIDAIVAALTTTMQSEGYKTPSRRVRLLDGTVVDPRW
jgi:ATP-dependent Clp protease ATP-binding subunit ClpA